jgi:hypothetical protein
MLNQRNKYEAEPQSPIKPAKSKAAPAVSSITEDKRYSAAAAILRTLEGGLRDIDGELDALRIEQHLSTPGAGDRRGRISPRGAALQARISAHRAKRKPAGPTAPAPCELAAGVAEVLAIISGTRPQPGVDRKQLIKQLETDRAVIHSATIAQQAVVDALRGELSAALATRLQKEHRELLLKIFRAAQALAAASDAEQELRKSVIDGGFLWRADLLNGPQLAWC